MQAIKYFFITIALVAAISLCCDTESLTAFIMTKLTALAIIGFCAKCVKALEESSEEDKL